MGSRSESSIMSSSEAPAFKARSDVRYRTVFDEGIVVRQRAAEVLVVNSVGARILELLREQSNAEDLVTRLSAEFEVERSELEADVRTFLDELTAAEVVERVERGAAG